MSEFPAYEAALLRAAHRRYGWRRWRPRVAVALVAAAVAGVVLLVARPEPADIERPAAWKSYDVRNYGVDVSLPPGWELAPTTLTPYLQDPHEILSATTFAPGVPRESCAMFPAVALERLQPKDALVSVRERGKGSPPFVPRQARFVPDPSGAAAQIAAGCIGRPVSGALSVTNFSVGPRNLSVLVVLGSGASPAVRGEAVQIVERLRFDARYVPWWPFSG